MRGLAFALSLALSVLLVATALLAQRRLFEPVPCRIRIIIMDRDSHAPVQNASVQLMDAVGGFAAGSEKITDSSGQAEFASYTGKHQVRIRGTEIEEYRSDFMVADNEPFHIERIAVVSKPVVGQTEVETSKKTVPAVRLKIHAKAKKEFDKGKQELDRQHWTESRQHFQKAIDLYPDYDLAYYGLARAATALEDNDGARTALETALRLNPGFADAQHDLAHIYLSDRNYAGALALLKEYLKSDPGSVWSLTNAAYAELQLHHFAEAVRDARQVHTLPHASFANSHIIAAYALEGLGNTQEAEDEFNLYLKEEPAGPNAARARAALVELQAEHQ